jgi:hypothetical protein
VAGSSWGRRWPLHRFSKTGSEIDVEEHKAQQLEGKNSMVVLIRDEMTPPSSTQHCATVCATHPPLSSSKHRTVHCTPIEQRVPTFSHAPLLLQPPHHLPTRMTKRKDREHPNETAMWKVMPRSSDFVQHIARVGRGVCRSRDTLLFQW